MYSSFHRNELLLCVQQHAVARLSYMDGDFPWHVYAFHPLPAFVRYAHLFAAEWRELNRLDYNQPDSLHFQAYVKICNFIKTNTCILQFQQGGLDVWHGFTCHVDGGKAWFKYGMWYQKFPIQHRDPNIEMPFHSSYTRRMDWWTKKR